jgi:hypothetical protein
MRMNHRSFLITTDIAAARNRTTRNYLKINRVDRKYDPGKNHLVLMVSTGEFLDEDVNVFLKDNSLVLEAPYHLDYTRPYRAHLVGNRVLNNYENEVSLIAFSEIKLKPGFHYSIQSHDLINPYLMKIILRSKRRSDVS